MKFRVMTLFPEMIMNALNESITGRAIKKGLLDVKAINIRDFAQNKYNHVDDYIYGGGSGMLMQPEPVYLAYQSVINELDGKIPNDEDSDTFDGDSNRHDENTEVSKLRKVIYMSPQGRTFTQAVARELSEYDELVFLCGHYEGIDERVLEMIVDEELSLGDFVLTGGELPAIVMIDAISRLIPGVLGKDDSAVYETFNDGLVEYPQYTRPEEFMGKKVPEVLLSGHHKKIEEWRFEQSLARTKEKRPDMYEKYLETHELPKKKVKKTRRHHKENESNE